MPYRKDSPTPSQLKREEARKEIMAAALKLFYTKGYENTTTRDIVRETGILNGSLYNRFKSKDEILFSIVSDAIVTFLDESERLMNKEKDPIKSMALPMALELYIASRSDNLADLIFHAHKSWDAIEQFVEMYRTWLKNVWQEFFHEHLEDEEFRISLVTVIGAIGNLCGSYAHGFKGDYRDVLEGLIKTAAVVIGLPSFEVRRTVEELAEVIEHGDITICGYRISDLDSIASE
jgi:AcrR family transcriptional regulator